MLTDEFLDLFMRHSIANGSVFTPGLSEVVAQAKEANRFRKALLTIAALGKKEDAKVAREAVEV
jgi:hypothetical protein